MHNTILKKTLIFLLLIPCFALAEGQGSGSGSSDYDQPIKITCPKISQDLKKGDTDESTIPKGQVSQLERFFFEAVWGGGQGSITGEFDEHVKVMVTDFQKYWKIPVSGIVGKSTREAMLKTCHRQDPPRGKLLAIPTKGFAPLKVHFKNVWRNIGIQDRNGGGGYGVPWPRTIGEDDYVFKTPGKYKVESDGQAVVITVLKKSGQK